MTTTSLVIKLASGDLRWQGLTTEGFGAKVVENLQLQEFIQEFRIFVFIRREGDKGSDNFFYTGMMMVTDNKKSKEQKQDISRAAAFGELEAGLLTGKLGLLVAREESKDLGEPCKEGLSEVGDYLDAMAGDSSIKFLPLSDGKDYPFVDIEKGKPLSDYVLGPFVRSSSEKEIFVGGEEGKSSSPVQEREVAEVPGVRRHRGCKVDIQKACFPDDRGGEVVVANDDRNTGSSSVHSNDVGVASGLETKQQKLLGKKVSKEVKGKSMQSEKELSVQAAGKVTGKKGVEHSSLEDLRAKDIAESDRKSLDMLIRQTIGWEPCMSFTNRPGDKPAAQCTIWPDAFDQVAAAAVNKIPKSLNIEELGLKMREESFEESTGAADLHSGELEMISSRSKAAGTLQGRAGLQGSGDRNLHSLKTVPQAMAAFAQAAAAAKATDLPGWPLLSPSKVQLQKCDKCTREFCSPFNHCRHSRMHRRSSHLDKDLSMKRKHIATFWDKLSPEEAQHIVSSKNCELEDLSGQSAVGALAVFMNQASAKSLPHAYIKAGQELLEIVENNRGVFPLASEQLLNVLDEASEKTFLCGEPPLAVQKYVYQGDAGKIQREEKNLIASLSFILEQTLVKAWMADKEAEALRNQQELVKEEEAAQMKRERHFQKKKKKKSRQKGLKERKGTPWSGLVAALQQPSSVEEASGSSDNSSSSSSSSGGTTTTTIVPSELSEQEEYAKEWAHKPRRIALFVEPSPFAYVSGYKNRYQNFIRYLRELGDEVLVVTTHIGVPKEFYGAKVIGSWSLPCPWYKTVPLSLALSPRIYKEVMNFKPDIIHASSPGIMVFGALVIAKLLSVPVVMAYHTHVPMYIPKYTFSWLVKPMWFIIKFLHRAADLTLVMSHALGKEMKAAGASTAEKIRIWRKGVDSESFHPRFKSQEMRNRLTNGMPDAPLVVHVGRLGVEKNLDFLKRVMDRIPEAYLAFIGDGPYRADLEQMFQGMNVTFTGMLQGEELSQAYASGDVFITPSESETLGFVVLEAMACGVSVVAARAGGIPDIVNQDGETGFLYTPGDVDDCVKKLRALLESPELREKVGSAGRAEVEKFDWRASTRQVRNEQYSAAIWFWRRRKQQLANRFLGWFKRPELQGS
ncbi:unnamed protein product [Sphagnum compactum]